MAGRVVPVRVLGEVVELRGGSLPLRLGALRGVPAGLLLFVVVANDLRCLGGGQGLDTWLGHGSIQITARYLHHLGDYADRAALDVLNNATSKARKERARRLPDRSRFGAGRGNRRTPDQGHSLGW